MLHQLYLYLFCIFVGNKETITSNKKAILEYIKLHILIKIIFKFTTRNYKLENITISICIYIYSLNYS